MIRRLCSTASHLIQVCLALFSIGATAAGPKTITLANGEWPPYTSESLPDYGSVSRLVTAAFAHEGIKVNYVFFPWKRALEESRAGKLDGTLIWARTDDREADFLYSDAVLTTNYVLFFRKDKPVHWNRLEDLRGLTIGGILGSTPTGEYAALAQQGVFKREVAATDALNLRKLAAGHLDAAGIEMEVGRYLLANEVSDIADSISYDPKPIVVVPDYLLISKKTADADELMRRFNHGLAAVKAATAPR